MSPRETEEALPTRPRPLRRAKRGLPQDSDAAGTFEAIALIDIPCTGLLLRG